MKVTLNYILIGKVHVPTTSPALAITNLKKYPIWGTGWGVQLVGALSLVPRVCGFDSWWQHIPRLWISSPVGVRAGGNQSLFLCQIAVPPSLSKTSKYILGWGFFKNPSCSNKAPPSIRKMLKRVFLAAQDRRASTTLWLNLWSKRPHMPKAGNTNAEQRGTTQYSPLVSKPELRNPSWPQNKFHHTFPMKWIALPCNSFISISCLQLISD